MPWGAFRSSSNVTVRSGCPVCLGSAKATTLPSLVSVASRTPLGLNTIMRACGASAKIAMWKPGGSFSRPRSSFSAWVQERSRRGNRSDVQRRIGISDCNLQFPIVVPGCWFSIGDRQLEIENLSVFVSWWLFSSRHHRHHVIQQPETPAHLFHPDTFVISVLRTAFRLRGGIGTETVGIHTQRPVPLVLGVTAGQPRHHRRAGKILCRHLPDRFIKGGTRRRVVGGAELP